MQYTKCPVHGLGWPCIETLPLNTCRLVVTCSPVVWRGEVLNSSASYVRHLPVSPRKASTTLFRLPGSSQLVWHQPDDLIERRQPTYLLVVELIYHRYILSLYIIVILINSFHSDSAQYILPEIATSSLQSIVPCWEMEIPHTTNITLWIINTQGIHRAKIY